jgi:hypothetical protein
MSRLHVVVACAFVVASVFGQPSVARAEHCSGALFDDVASRLRAIESEQPLTVADIVRRSNELITLLADPNAPLWQGTTDACPGDGAQSRLQTIARQRVLVLWGKMVALGAVDGPIFPTPYAGACRRYDGSSLQLDFIHAWVERLDDGGSGFSRGVMWRALDDDTLYGHVQALARDRAERLKISSLPSLNSDDDAWLQGNEALRARYLTNLPRGSHCGTLYGLWGLERGGAPNAPPGAGSI